MFSIHSPKSGVTWAGLLLLITLVFYWKILLTHQFSLLTGGEGVNQAYSWLNFLAHDIKQGSWPLWDPYTLSGHVFAGETQDGAFYPLYPLLALFPLNRHELLSPALYHMMYAAVHFLAAWFMFRLVCELELGNFAAIVAAICFSLGGLMGRWPEWPHLLNSGIWLPWIFVFLLKALKTPRAPLSVFYASACGLGQGLSILAGGIHIVIMQVIVIGTAVVFYRLQPDFDSGPSPGNRWRRSALVIAVAGCLTLASGAVQLLSSIEYSHRAVRWVGAPAFPVSKKIPYNYTGDGLYAHSLVTLLVPFAYGGNIGPGETANPYIGVFPLLLAAIGIWKSWRRPWVRYLTGLAAAAFAYSLGSFSLLHGVLYALVPYLWLAREASRFMYLADFALAILAAYGAEALLASQRSEWLPLSRVLNWLALAALAALAVPALFLQVPLNPWTSLSLVLILAAWILFCHISAGHHGAWPRSLAVALILFDLGAFDWSETNRAELAAKGVDQMDRLLSTAGVAHFLKSQPGLFRAEVVEGAPNLGDAFQVQITGGAGVTLLTGYADFRARRDLLNVRYIVKPATDSEPAPVYQDGTWKVYENPQPYPRAWLAHDTIVEPDPAKLLGDLDDPGIDPRRVALLPARLDAPLDPAADAAADLVRFVRYEANRLDLTVHTGGRALLVLSEMYYPGWTATVNSQAEPIRKVDGMLRAVVVPGGDSRISLRYRPALIYIGAALSLASAGAVLLAAVWLRFRGRRIPPEAAPSQRS